MLNINLSTKFYVDQCKNSTVETVLFVQKPITYIPHLYQTLTI